MKEIKDYPGYFVTKEGKIWSPKRLAFLIPFDRNVNGYPSVYVYKQKKKSMIMIHHAVLEAFVGPRPDKHVAAHLDGNPRNNNLENLKWVTQKENLAHRKIHGTETNGEKNGNSKLTQEQAQFILNDESYTTAEIARILNVSDFAVVCVRKRKTWVHLNKTQRTGNKIYGFKKEFFLKYKNIVDIKDLSRILGITECTSKKIIKEMKNG